VSVAKPTAKPWERQAWESAADFRSFRFYFDQEPPRSVDEAFRRWRLQRGYKEATYFRAPGLWRRRSLGQDRNGNRIPGSLTWRERADAWDAHLTELANAKVEREWGRLAMQKAEVLGRLAQQARASIADFYIEQAQPILDGEGQPVFDEDGNPLITIVTTLDWDALRKNGHMIKSLTPTRYGTKVEMYDGQSALVHIGRHLKLFTDQVDVTSLGKAIQDTENLTDDQFKRTLTQLSEIGLALAGRKDLPEAQNDAEERDSERQVE